MKPLRNPEVFWRDEPSNNEEALRRMREGGDFATVGVLTVAAEDEISQLNYVGAEIWKLCDGTRDLAAIAETLAARFDAPPENLRLDVETFVRALIDKGWLQAAS